MGRTAQLDRVLKKLEQDLGEVIERHDRASRPLADFARYKRDPVGFITEVLGETTMWDAQIHIANAVYRNPLCAVASCNSAGKDWLAGRLALWAAYARDAFVLLTGPTQRQVKEILFGEIRGCFRKADLPGDLYSMALRLPEGREGSILGFTSTDASSLTGFHAAEVFAIITEGQGVDSFGYEAMMSCAVGEHDRILVVGNPTTSSGEFYDAFEGEAQEQWWTKQISAYDHPNLKEGTTVIRGAITQRAVDRMARQWGKESNAFRSRVLGEFPEIGERGLVARSWVQEARRRFDSGEADAAAEHQAPVIAVDVARYGMDATVICVKKGPKVIKFYEYRDLSTVDTTRVVEKLAIEHGLVQAEEFYANTEYENASDPSEMGIIVVDVVGIGAGVFDTLEEAEWPVVEYNAGMRPIESDRFRNARAESFWLLREALERGELAIPNSQELMQELYALKWGETSTGHVAMDSKREMKRDLGRSPDYADSLAMAVYGPYLDTGLGNILTIQGYTP
jgi:hypothetical protein